MAAVVDLALERAADKMTLDRNGELAVDAAVDRLAFDRESRLAVELDFDGTIDCFHAQVAVQQLFLADADGAVDGIERSGLELALEIDLAVHRLQGQVGEFAGAIQLAVDRFEQGPGELFWDGDGKIDLGFGIALVILGIDLQRVFAGLKDDFHAFDLVLVIGLFYGLDVHGRTAGGGHLDLAIDAGQIDGTAYGQFETAGDLLLVILGGQHGEHEKHYQ